MPCKKLVRNAVFLLCMAVTSVQAQTIESFVISDIRVEGLQRISAGTVFNYLPVKVGDEFEEAASAESIRALFQTGFFRDVRLSRAGRTLVVQVDEFPTIFSIEFTGNKGIEDDALRDAMSQAEFIEGRVFNPTVLDQVVQELKNQYLSRGKYAAEVETDVQDLARNRVAVKINVREGDTATIKKISIVGNESFSDKELLDEFESKTSSLLNFFSKKNQYSKETVSSDLETLTSFYQDQGFLNFRIDSTQVSITPDRENIYLTINVVEGEQYRISQFKLTGRLIVPEEELLPLVYIAPGELYSRALVDGTVELLTTRLAAEGYSFAEINPVPEIDEDSNTVSFTINVNPGRRVYVRRIEIIGNNTTRDEVIRRELRQLEGGWYSPALVQRSKIRLQRLGFFDVVEIDNEPVPGSTDQVDLIVSLTERSTGSFLVGVGFSDGDGILLQSSVTQANLFGSGKQLSLGADRSSIIQSVNVQYTNPYATDSGISRGFNLVYQRIDSFAAQTAAYITQTLGGGVNYLFPLSEFMSFSAGVSYDKIDLESTQFTPPEIVDFIDANPSNNVYKLTSALAYDTRDSLLYATRGLSLSLNLEVAAPGSGLEYYKANARASWYVPLIRDFVFKVSGDFGYGDSYGGDEGLPFFKNYFAGGVSSVRGYEIRSLGPRDSNFNPLGGASRILTNASLLLPIPGSTAKDKRFALFIDGGQVYGPNQSIELSEMRYSAGIGFNWLSPMGPLAISYAKPLNSRIGDETESIQFNIGRVFD
jgi:outer membrane protein insertion porin family